MPHMTIPSRHYGRQGPPVLDSHPLSIRAVMPAAEESGAPI